MHFLKSEVDVVVSPSPPPAGLCTCYPGFEGRACDRTVCPNSCSGHGTCQALTTFFRDQTDLLGGSQHIVSYTQGLQTWDALKTYGCKCESGFRGPDCSLQECPTGTDPQVCGKS